MKKQIRIPKWCGQKTVIVTLVLLGTAVLTWQWIDKTRLRHFCAVTPGVLYRSACPRPRKLKALIRRHGFRTVVNLCLPVENPDGRKWTDEAAVCDMLGVELVNIPLPGNTPPSPRQVEQWLDIVSSPECRPMLVHCAQGVIRTNAMVAIYRIGVNCEDNRTVLHQLPDFGHDLFTPKRKALNDFILGWKPPELAVHAGTDSLTPSLGGIATAPRIRHTAQVEVD